MGRQRAQKAFLAGPLAASLPFDPARPSHLGAWAAEAGATGIFGTIGRGCRPTGLVGGNFPNRPPRVGR